MREKRVLQMWLDTWDMVREASDGFVDRGRKWVEQRSISVFVERSS